MIVRMFPPVAALCLLSLTLSTAMVQARLLLSEVMTDNGATVLDEEGEAPDWVELHNAGDLPIDLAGHFLTDDPEDLNHWEFPAVTLEPGGYLLVFASGKDRRQPGGELHTNFQLKNGGEFLALVGPDRVTVLDAFEPEIPQLDEDQSYGVRDSGGNFVLHYFDQPTPGAANTGGSVAEEVVFSVRGGPFVGQIEVALSSRSGSPITYTTDGKRPSLFNGKTYSEPVVLTKTTILSAAISRGPLEQEVYFQVTPELAATTSNLPLVLVHSDGTIGPSYDSMLLGILEPEEEEERTRVEGAFSMDSQGAIKTRGSSTQAFPKKSYRLEFQDADGDDLVKKPLGMPAESDWILSGRYEEDRALIRNEFTYALSRQIGRYAARTRFCEVYVSDGQGPVDVSDYVGVYSFMEAIKRDADRIDIEELTPEDNEAPAITGGYIFKVDRSGPNDTVTTAGSQSIAITEPARGELTPEQLTYLRDYLGEMAASFSSSDPETGYPSYIDVGSWIDHHLINTLMLNVDSLRLSTFFYKEREGKVFAGPVWDFNISSGSRDRFGSPPRPSNPTVWRGISGDRGTTFFSNGTQRWWGDLFADRDFQQAYADRWNALREGAFSTENLHALIDGMADEIREAQPRNQARWPQVPPEYGGWQGEIDHLKDWLATRAAWIDEELVAPPVITPAGGTLEEGTAVTMEGRKNTLFNRTKVYYTLDGTDPRASGGGIAPQAREYTGGVVLEDSATVTAREYLPNYTPKPDGPDQEWSAPARLAFVVGAEAASSSNLVVSEIMYHPANPSAAEVEAGFTNDDAFEYIELTNVGARSVDLLGVAAADGVDGTVAQSVVLAPGSSAVLVVNEGAFRLRYGQEPVVAGVYTGQLANSGERLLLLGATGEVLWEFRYNDNDPWPGEADGEGSSLELLRPNERPDPADPAQWRASVPGGTPGRTGEIDPPVGLTYDVWAKTALPGGISNAKAADPDGDGLSNLAEYALGSDPVVWDSVVRVARSGDENLVVTFSKRLEVTDAVIVVETSPDLANWSTFTGSLMEGDLREPGVQEMEAVLPLEVTGFVRLAVLEIAQGG